MTFFRDEFRALSNLRNVKEALNRHLAKNINYEIKLNENKFYLYEKKVNASLISEKEKEKKNTHIGRKPIRDLKLRQRCTERSFYQLSNYYFQFE